MPAFRIGDIVEWQPQTSSCDAGVVGTLFDINVSSKLTSPQASVLWSDGVASHCYFRDIRKHKTSELIE